MSIVPVLLLIINEFTKISCCQACKFSKMNSVTTLTLSQTFDSDSTFSTCGLTVLYYICM